MKNQFLINFAKAVFALFACAFLIWLIFWAFEFFQNKKERDPFTLYSSLKKDFISITADGGVSSDGETLSQNQCDSLLPFFYYRQLITDDKFPDTICGAAVSPRLVQNENFIFRSTPSELLKPELGLYFLLESRSPRVDLEIPDDVFRLTENGIEFIEMESNTVLQEKSELFSALMKKKNFRFPATLCAGNGTTRKDYDLGYMLLDADGSLFNLRQVQGKPYLRPIALPDGVKLRHIYVTEFRAKRTLAFAFDENLNFWVLLSDYTWHKTALPSFDPKKNDFSIFGNLLDWTVKISGEKTAYYAINWADFSILKEKNSLKEEKN